MNQPVTQMGLARISHHTGQIDYSVPLLRRSSARRNRLARHCLCQAVAHRGEKCALAAALAMMIVAVASATEKTAWDKLAGQPVDIAPWAYAWRADRAVQPKPEAYFIPRRLDRIDKVYRTAYAALSPDRLKSIAYANQPDLLKPLLPKPTGPTAGGIALDGTTARLQGRAPVAGERSADSFAARPSRFAPIPRRGAGSGGPSIRS